MTLNTHSQNSDPPQTFSIDGMAFQLFGLSTEVSVAFIIGLCAVCIALIIFLILLISYCCFKRDYSSLDLEDQSNDPYRFAVTHDGVSSTPSGKSHQPSHDPLTTSLI
jgi:hypothetical protein